MRTCDRIIPLAVLGLMLVSSGCMKPNPLVQLLAEAGSETGDSDESDTNSGDESPAPALPLDLGADSCEPHELFELACASCLAESCCEVAQSCTDDPDCACLAECFSAGNNNGVCKNLCGLKRKDSPAYQALASCSAGPCQLCSLV